MIKLLKPINHLGGLVSADTVIFLGDKEAALVKSGAAEYYPKEIKGPEEEPEEEPEQEPEQEPEMILEKELVGQAALPEFPLGRRGRK